MSYTIRKILIALLFPLMLVSLLVGFMMVKNVRGEDVLVEEQTVKVLKPNDSSIHYNTTWEFFTDTVASTCTGLNYFTYTGNFTTIEWWGEKSENITSANVYIDDVLVINHKANSDATERNTSVMLFTSGVLSLGEHTLKVEHSGSPGWISVDKLVVYKDTVAVTKIEKDDTDISIAYSNFSAFSVGTGFHNSTVHSASAQNAYYEFTQDNLRKFVIWSDRNWSRGKFDVYIDNKKVDTVNLYDGIMNDAKSYPVYVSPILTNDSHSVKVVNIGEKDILATEYWITLDKLEMYCYPTTGGGEEDTQVFDNNALGYVGSWATYSNLGGMYYKGTANSTCTAGDYMLMSFNNATSIQVWGTKAANRALADVYLDGQFVETIDTYSATQTSSTIIWQIKGLSTGIHTVKIVNKGQTNGTEIWLEIDKITTKGVDLDNMIINGLNGSFVNVKGATYVGDEHTGYYNIAKDDILTLTVKGTKIALFAPNGIQGEAKILIDNSEVKLATINAEGGKFFEIDNLSNGYHKIVVMNNSGQVGFAYATTNDSQLLSIGAEMYNRATSEIEDKKNGTWQLSDPTQWNPVAYQYQAPTSGVSLTGGKMQEMYNKNLNYLTTGLNLTNGVDAPQPFWVDMLGGSNEGRLMQGYANSLIWSGDNQSYRTALDTILTTIRARQIENNGYALPYEELAMAGYNDAALDERRNYDRAMFTRGLVAAGNYYTYIGISVEENPAYVILRDFYDWFNFNSNKYGEKMLEGFLGPQGHIGSTLTYFTPVGVTDDMLYAELSYIQNWWLEYLANGKDEAIWKYPLDRPHCYLITALDAYLDHYRATGDSKYLDACLGFWKIMNENFIHEGGCMAICEHRAYEPGSYYISEATHTGELCGTVFWTDFNYKLLQLFPDEEKYAREIEQSILNVLAVAQGSDGKIIYHQNLNGHLRSADRINSCCEVTAVGLIARLPSFIYQLSDNGIKVSLYSDSEINSTYNGKTYHLQMTGDIYSTDTYKIKNLGEQTTLSLRIPSWVSGAPQILINGIAINGEIALGSYVDISIKNNDVITVKLPKEIVPVKYNGYEQVDGYNRYCFKYGPLLYSVIPNGQCTFVKDGNENIISLECDVHEFINSINLPLGIAGLNGEFKFVPYSSVGQNTFSAFPLTIDNPDSYEYSASVTLNSDIALNYYFKLNDKFSGAEMSFSYNGRNTTVVAVYDEAKGMYKVSFTDIAPQGLGDKVRVTSAKATLKSDGSQVDILTDWETIWNGYTVAEYLYSIVNLESLEGYSTEQLNKLKTLAVDLLNYGTAAQNYIGNNQTLINGNLTNDQYQMATKKGANDMVASDVTFSKGGDATKASWVNTNIYYDNKVGVQYTFKVTSGTEVKVVTNGSEITEFKTKVVDGVTQYTFTVYMSPTLFATPNTYTVVVDGEETITLTANLNFNIRERWVNSTSNTYKALVNALYKYGLSAQAING